MPIIEGSVGRAQAHAGAPSNGTDEVQTITIGGTPTGGDFTLSFRGFITAPIAWSATNATLVANVQAALDALPTVGAGSAVVAVGTMTAGIGTLTVTFAANLGRQALPLMVAEDAGLVGTAPTAAVTETTPGVDSSPRGIGTGGMVTDTTNGKLYINTGTALDPTWAVVGTQT